jgi:hypothetical protein
MKAAKPRVAAGNCAVPGTWLTQLSVDGDTAAGIAVPTAATRPDSPAALNNP